MPTYEVELKFRLAGSQAEEVLSIINELGGKRSDSIEQQDLYFAHPQRDFVQTDEALRIRACGDENCLTYKGPKVGGPTKTRHEIETTFGSGRQTCEQLAETLEILGFRRVRTVVKQRVAFALSWDGYDYTLALDTVEGLGEFIEIELLANEDDRDAAGAAVLKLAGRLQLQEPERRSYLGMLEGS